MPERDPGEGSWKGFLERKVSRQGFLERANNLKNHELAINELEMHLISRKFVLITILSNSFKKQCCSLAEQRPEMLLYIFGMLVHLQ